MKTFIVVVCSWVIGLLFISLYLEAKNENKAPSAKKAINPGCYGACFGAYVLCRDNCHVMGCQDFCYLQLQNCLDNCIQ